MMIGGNILQKVLKLTWLRKFLSWPDKFRRLSRGYYKQIQILMEYVQLLYVMHYEYILLYYMYYVYIYIMYILSCIN